MKFQVGMYKNAVRLIIGVAAGLFCLISASTASAAAFNINCANFPNANGDQVINQPNDDVTLACNLTGRSVRIVGLSITITPAGSITTSGIAGMRLLAGLNSNGNACGAGVDPSNAYISLNDTTLTDSNGNGLVRFRACGDIAIADSTLTSAGANVEAQCYDATGPDLCEISVDHSQVSANNISLIAEGDLTLECNDFQTHGPRDNHEYISKQGNIIAGRVTVLSQIAPPGCTCELGCGDRYQGGVESNALWSAYGYVDMQGACVEIAENITITALGNFAPLDGDIIDLSFAEIRDDFGKPGRIRITATPVAAFANPIDGGTQTGTGKINIEQALIIEHGNGSGGGTDLNAVAEMNGGTQTVAGPCAQIDAASSCVNRDIDLAKNPVHADSAKRTNRNVAGAAVVRCDT